MTLSEIRLRHLFFKIHIIMEIRNLKSRFENWDFFLKNNLTGLIGIIWKLRIWNMKKIGKKKRYAWLTDMISTFRAFASGVRELKTKDIHEFIKVKYKYLCYYQIGYYILLNFNQQMMVNFILRYFYLYFVWKKVLRKNDNALIRMHCFALKFVGQMRRKYLGTYKKVDL